MSNDFQRSIKLLEYVFLKYTRNMNKEMLEDVFFNEVWLLDLLNINYEEYRSIETKTENKNVDYNNTVQKLLNKYNLSDDLIKSIINDYYEEYNKF